MTKASPKITANREIKELKTQIQTLESQLAEYKNIIATIKPKHIKSILPKQIEKYNPTLDDKVIALGYIGKSPDVIQVELGITKENWKKWKKTFSSFNLAVSRARALGKAYWIEKGRMAMERNEWRFQLDKLPRLLSMFYDEDEIEEMGDATTLIILDTRPPN